MDEVTVYGQLTRQQARELTDEAKADVTMLWAKLYALHEGKAHEALGYTNWGAYTVAEFGWSATVGKETLYAGRVRAALERKVGIPTLPDNVAVAQALAPVLHKAPELLEGVWSEAVATAEGEAPTAAEVRAVVDRRAPEVRPRRTRKRRLSRYERAQNERQEYTERLREIERASRGARQRVQSGKLVEGAVVTGAIGDWVEILRKIEDNARTAREMIHEQAVAINRKEHR